MKSKNPEFLWEARGMVVFESGACGLPQCRLIHRGKWLYPPGTPAPEGMSETDPWFIIGNYGLSVFAHASGSYQLMHTERGFARLNHDGSDLVTGRACRSLLKVGGKVHDLLNIPADERVFGCGFASYKYSIGALRITRRLETLPSSGIKDRIPAFNITLEISNGGGTELGLQTVEGIGARYDYANWRNPPPGRKQTDYKVNAGTEGKHAVADFVPEPKRPLVFDVPGRFAQADKYPAKLHLSARTEAELEIEEESEDCAWLTAKSSFRLAPGAAKTLVITAGWSDDELEWGKTFARMDTRSGEIRQAWSDRLPSFEEEKKPALRGELIWHAHTIHAMATWDARYKCVFIPQGTLYEYGLGVAAVTRDHAMHALPACTYDPELARSVLSFLARHTDMRGDVHHSDEGAGIVPVGGDRKSDSQLFCLLLATEYLERTGDIDSLDDREPFFPCGSGDGGSLLSRIARWVTYLRDGIHVGRNGLVRVMLSDLSDTLHSAFPHLQYSHRNYHRVFNGESYVNTVMAVNVLHRLSTWIDSKLESVKNQRELASELRDACIEFEEKLREALLRDLKGRPWVPRARMEEEFLGGEDAFSAPQAFLFSYPGIPEKRRREIWANVKSGIWDREPFGVRLREGEGKHRCGMVWYAWSGLFAWNLADIDPVSAAETLERISLKRRAELEPEQWVGLWSNSDVTWAYEGAGPENIPGTTRVGYVKAFPLPCAHVHAWPIMLWLKSQF